MTEQEIQAQIDKKLNEVLNGFTQQGGNRIRLEVDDVKDLFLSCVQLGRNLEAQKQDAKKENS